MEPIELNGKSFCSNCGLTIGAATTKIHAPISSFPEPPTDLQAPTPAASDEVTPEIGTPLTDETAKELGIVPETEEATPEPEEKKEPVKLSVGSQENPPTPTDGSLKDLATQILGDEDTKEPSASSLLPPEEKMIPAGTNEEDSRVNKIEIPDEEDFGKSGIPLTAPESEPAKADVDTLGASGILLDILGDNLAAKEDEKEIESMKAAEDLLPDLDYGDSEKHGKDKSEHKAKEHHPAEKKHPKEAPILADILAGKPQNPEENLELESPLAETEIAAPIAEDIPMAAPESQPKPEEDLYTLPNPRKSKKGSKKTAKKVEENVAPEILAVEKEIAETQEPKVTLTPEQAEDYDPDTLPKNSVAFDDKQEVLTQFFKSKMAKSVKNGKPKIKKAKGKRKLWLIPISIFIVLILLAGATIGYFYLYKPMAAPKTTQTTVKTTLQTMEPSSIVDGYQQTTSELSTDGTKLTVVYAATADPTKTITFTQAKVQNTNDYIASFTQKPGSTYAVKDVNGTNFTELNGKSLLWVQNGYVFCLETANYDKTLDLLYKMAESVS